MLIIALYHLITNAFSISNAAIAPPPWANPKFNPCAVQPRGWQLLYWPPDGKCYKIFQVGYPCPEGMELSPSAIKLGNGHEQFSAECRCPPKTAQYARDGRCYELFSLGPCEIGHYFAPDTEAMTKTSNKRQWGICRQIEACSSSNEISWPQNNRCYMYLTKGPCPKGQLMTVGPDKLAECKCNYFYEMRNFWYEGHGCFEHFTKGPCKEHGHLFLPDRTCGCNENLPHYHNETGRCYELGSIGPCQTGEQFELASDLNKALCSCKKGYIRYDGNEGCYRPYTQGPCNANEILVNETTCIEKPCHSGYLYFPKTQSCHRVGSQGPCTRGHVITFDFDTRPSLDGVSYNGICHCKKTNEMAECEKIDANANVCGNDTNTVAYNGKCYKLYGQGPCAKGAWLVIKRQGKDLWSESTGQRETICECMPRYKESVRILNGQNVTECIPPTVILADFLNNHTKRQPK